MFKIYRINISIKKNKKNIKDTTLKITITRFTTSGFIIFFIIIFHKYVNSYQYLSRDLYMIDKFKHLS